MYLLNIVDDNISQENIISFIDNLLDNGITDFKLFINKKYKYSYENYIVRSDYTDIRNFYDYIYNNYNEIIRRNVKIIYLNLTYDIIESTIDLIYQIKKLYSNGNNKKYINIINNDIQSCIYDETKEYLEKYIYNSDNFTQQEAIEEANNYIKNNMKIKKMYKKILKKDLNIKKFYFSEDGFFFNGQYCNIKKIFLKMLIEIFESSNIDTITTLTEAFLFDTLSSIKPFLLNLNTNNFYITEHKNKNYDSFNYILNMNNKPHLDISNNELDNKIEEIVDQSNNTFEISDISTENTIINEYITNSDCVNCTKFNFSGKPHLFTYFCSMQCKEKIMNNQEKILE